jgi:chromosome segregation ATPase
MKADFLAVSASVRFLEDKVTNFRKKLTECENSCQGVNNLFDQADSQIKHNTRNIIHQDTRIKKLEEKSVVHPLIQPVTESGQQTFTI